jgi:hypothetical protein
MCTNYTCKKDQANVTLRDKILIHVHAAAFRHPQHPAGTDAARASAANLASNTSNGLVFGFNVGTGSIGYASTIPNGKSDE